MMLSERQIPPAPDAAGGRRSSPDHKRTAPLAAEGPLLFGRQLPGKVPASCAEGGTIGVRPRPYAGGVARPAVQYACSECGYSAGRWFGKCPGCSSFGTLVEEV